MDAARSVWFASDHAFGADGGDDEADVCRVCRSGAPEDGELFWPCQCSGSMKVCGLLAPEDAIHVVRSY